MAAGLFLWQLGGSGESTGDLMASGTQQLLDAVVADSRRTSFEQQVSYRIRCCCCGAVRGGETFRGSS